MRQFRFFLIFLCAICIFSKAAFADTDASNVNPVDNTQSDKPLIEDFRKFLTVRTFLQSSAVDLTIKRYDKTKNDTNYSDEIKYQPNQPENLGFGLSWKGFGLSYKFGLSISDSQREKYGSTSYQDWRIYYYGQKFGIDAILQNYKGFSLESPGNYGYNTGDPETKRSDLQVSTLGLNVYYVFSDHYSLASSFNQSERQTTCGGSFLLMLSTTLYSVKGNHSLIPASEQTQYGNDASFSGGNYGSIGIAPGAAYTLVYKNFYLTPVFFFGTGFMNKKNTTSSGVINKTESYIKLNLRGSAGYNGDGFFCGLAIFDDVTDSERWFGKGTGMAVQVDVINIEIFFGKRFDFDPFSK